MQFKRCLVYDRKFKEDEGTQCLKKATRKVVSRCFDGSTHESFFCQRHARKESK